MFAWPQKRRATDDHNAPLVRVIAERSAAELIGQIDTWPVMGVAEMRGYVRARVGACVRQQLQLAAVGNQAVETLPEEVVAAASERAVYLIVREQLSRSQLPVVRRTAA